jgi:orotidine-5'-phosphate decarboxylase
MPTPIQAKDRLILALDLPDIAAARAMVNSLDGVVNFFKVGLTLQLAEGVEDFVRELIRAKKRVFLDYKYYDVPETLKKAVSRAAELGVSFLTMHGSRSKLFIVTVLTSMDVDDIYELGYTQPVDELVRFRAQRALEAGCDGVIASGREAKMIKELSKNKLLVVTPGIRSSDYPSDDQKRRVTARDAILAGADYLVIGRPITDEADPRAAALRYIEEMQAAIAELPVSA